MTRNQAIQKIRRSLNECEPQVLTPKGKIYEEHIAVLSDKLLSQVIDPIRVNVTSTIIRDADFNTYNNGIVWGIAKSKRNWLLTLQDARVFALGFGDNPNEIMMHGCSSNDALGEWCA